MQGHQQVAENRRGYSRQAHTHSIVLGGLLDATEEAKRVAQAHMCEHMARIHVETAPEPTLSFAEPVRQHVRHGHVVERVGVIETGRDNTRQIGKRAFAVAALQSQHAHAVRSFGVARIDAQGGKIAMFRLRQTSLALMSESRRQQHGGEVRHVRLKPA